MADAERWKLGLSRGLNQPQLLWDKDIQKANSFSALRCGLLSSLSSLSRHSCLSLSSLFWCIVWTGALWILFFILMLCQSWTIDKGWMDSRRSTTVWRVLGLPSDPHETRFNRDSECSDVCGWTGDVWVLYSSAYCRRVLPIFSVAPPLWRFSVPLTLHTLQVWRTESSRCCTCHTHMLLMPLTVKPFHCSITALSLWSINTIYVLMYYESITAVTQPRLHVV